MAQANAAAREADGVVDLRDVETPRDIGTKSLTRNGMALMVNSGLSAALGGVFSLAAARLFMPEEYGQDTALVSAMLFLAAVGNLNLGAGLPRFLPQLGRRSRDAVMLSYLVTCVASVVLALGFVAFACRFVEPLRFLCEDRLMGGLFVLAVAGWNIFGLQDAVLVAMRKAHVVLVENLIFNLAKVIFVVVFGLVVLEHGILWSWLVPMAALLIPINYYLFWVALPQHTQHRGAASSMIGTANARSRMVKFLALDYVGYVFMQASFTLLPVLVVAMLGRTENAYFYAAFLVATTVGQMGESVALQLTVEGAFDERALSRLTAHTLKRFGAVLLPGIVFIVIFAWYLMRIFGAEYAEHSTTILRLLAIAAVPTFLLSVYQGVQRVRNRADLILYTQLARAVLVLGVVGLLLQRHSVVGAGIGWLIAHTVMGLIVLPSLVRIVCRGHEPELFREVSANSRENSR